MFFVYLSNCYFILRWFGACHTVNWTSPQCEYSKCCCFFFFIVYYFQFSFMTWNSDFGWATEPIDSICVCSTIAFEWRITSRIGDCIIFSSYSKQSIQWSYRDHHLVFIRGRMWVAYVLFNIKYNWIWFCVFFLLVFVLFRFYFIAVPFLPLLQTRIRMTYCPSSLEISSCHFDRY